MFNASDISSRIVYITYAIDNLAAVSFLARDSHLYVSQFVCSKCVL